MRFIKTNPMNNRSTIIYSFIVVLFLLTGCCRNDKNGEEISAVSFPEPPIELVDNEAFGMGLINYFNIIQLPEGGYRMYFSGNENSGIAEDEFGQNLYWAESADGFHYDLKGKVMDKLIESSVSVVDDPEWPFRLIGNQIEDGKHCMFLWKSKDGISFSERKMLYDFKHDTQNTLVPRGDRMKLYSRLTQEHFQNRRVTLTEFTLDGDQVSDTEILAGDCLYNSAACKVDERYDLMFPTYYNTHGGTTDTCCFRTYVVDGSYVRQLPCDLNRWITPDELWALASPGFITIGGDRYLAFATRTRSHDQSVNGMVSKYKLIKTVIDYKSR